MEIHLQPYFLACCQDWQPTLGPHTKLMASEPFRRPTWRGKRLQQLCNLQWCLVLSHSRPISDVTLGKP